MPPAPQAGREELEKLLNRRSTPQQIALRAKIILLADKGSNNRDIGRALNISRYMARRWRNRWLELSERAIPVIERLQDGERSGVPAKFRMEQVVELFALACSKPEDYGRPISDWTARELAAEMEKQGIVESISPRHVGRLLEEAQIKPHALPLLVDSPPSITNLIPKLKIYLIYTSEQLNVPMMANEQYVLMK